MPLFNPPDAQWIAASLTPGWQPFGFGWQIPQYARIGDLIYLRGAAQWVYGGYDIFSLPEGYRPGSPHVFPVATNNGSFASTGLLQLQSSGVVQWGGVGGLWFVGMDGVVFGTDP